MSSAFRKSPPGTVTYWNLSGLTADDVQHMPSFPKTFTVPEELPVNDIVVFELVENVNRPNKGVSKTFTISRTTAGGTILASNTFTFPAR